MLTLVEVGLRHSSFIRCRAILERLQRYLPFRSRQRSCPDLAQEIADIIDRSVGAASIYPAQCLTRSLVLNFFLKRYGQESRLRLGVQTITGNFRAHAWVESHGQELNEQFPANEIYQPLDLA